MVASWFDSSAVIPASADVGFDVRSREVVKLSDCAKRTELLGRLNSLFSHLISEYVVTLGNSMIRGILASRSD